MSDDRAGALGPRLVMAGMGLGTLGVLALACVYVLWMTQTRSAVRNASVDMDRLAFVFCVALGPGGLAGLLVSLGCALKFEARAALRVVAPIAAGVLVSGVMGASAMAFYEAVVRSPRSLF